MDKRKQITANLGRDAKQHEGTQVPKTTVQVPMKDGDQKVWVAATMTGKLAEEFKDANKGDRITVSGELKTVKDTKGEDKLVMDVERAFKHKDINLEAKVLQEPKLGTAENSPARVFTMAKLEGKDVIINLSDFKDRDAIMALQKGDKIQVEGDARISANNNPRPGTHDFKYEVVNPTITTPGQEKAVDQTTAKTAPEPNTQKPEKAAPSPTERSAEPSKQFIAGTENHSLYKVGKQYEVIKKDGDKYTLEKTATSRKQGLDDLKSSETALQKDKGVENPKVKASTKKTREYPPTVDRSAVKLSEKTTKRPGIEV